MTIQIEEPDSLVKLSEKYDSKAIVNVMTTWTALIKKSDSIDKLLETFDSQRFLR